MIFKKHEFEIGRHCRAIDYNLKRNTFIGKLKMVTVPNNFTGQACKFHTFIYKNDSVNVSENFLLSEEVKIVETNIK